MTPGTFPCLTKYHKSRRNADFRCREMVAWAGLQYPWSTIPEMTPDLIQALTNPAQPTSYPAGTNLEALHELFSIMFEAAEKYGFDPYHDFSKSNSHLLS